MVIITPWLWHNLSDESLMWTAYSQMFQVVTTRMTAPTRHNTTAVLLQVQRPLLPGHGYLHTHPPLHEGCVLPQRVD